MKFSLTPSNLSRIRDDELAGAMWEYYLRYCEYMRKKNRGRKGWLSARQSRALDLSLPRGLRLVHSLIRFDGDILNGGISQYIGNHTWDRKPDEVLEDLEALKTIGARASAKILQEAILIVTRDYGWPTWSHRSVNCDLWEHPELERLDKLRCNDKSSHRDYRLLNAYLRKHLDECVLPVTVECRSMDEFLRPRKSKR